MVNIKFETFISYYTSSFILAIVSKHKVVHEARKYLLNRQLLFAHFLSEQQCRS